MKTAQQIALWADRLRDVSALGLLYAKGFHDREAFQAVQTLAMEMLACATGETMEEMELLRAPIFSRATPMATADAAVIDAGGRLLLIQRADNRKWAFPGGLLDVGETPTAGAVREALEETGVQCRVIAPIGVYDSRLSGAVSRHHMYQFTFLCEPMTSGKPEPPSHAVEVLGSGWFSEDRLPGDIDPGHATRIPDAFRVWHGDGRVFFDGIEPNQD